MIWHIFQKDWKLMRWYVIGLALINLLSHLAHEHLGRQLMPMAEVLGVLALMTSGFLVMMIVQTDAIPGLRQDWLIRPVKRTDLLVSKLAFVVLLIQTPVFLLEVSEGIAAGFPFAQAVSVPLSRSIWVLLAWELPVFAFATVTRNLVEAVGATIAAGTVLGLLTTATFAIKTRHIAGSQLDWVGTALQVFWCLLFAVAVISLQYLRRKTIASRWISAVGFLGAVLLANAVPWKTAFAVQRQFSSHPEAADSIHVEANSTPLQMIAISARDNVTVSLPLQIDGVRQDELLLAENITGRVRRRDGTATELGYQQPLPMVPGVIQSIILTETLYREVKDQPVRLELDYDLTVLKGDAPQGLPAVNGNRYLEGIGSCTTTADPEFGAVKLNCATLGDAPCAVWFAENLQKPQPNGQQRGCMRNYSPWFSRINGGSITNFGGDIFLSDITKGVEFPVDRSQFDKARVMVRVFHPEAHFTRQVVVPAIKLSDWSAEK